MERTKDLAIVLKAVPFQDRHLIVTALTKSYGRITALAKNAIHSRRFGGTLDHFCASEWTWTAKPQSELVFLEQTTFRHSFEDLKAGFENLTLGSVFTEIVLRISQEREPAPELFIFYSNALALIPKTLDALTTPRLLNVFLLKVLKWCGSQPNLHSCLKCEQAFGSTETYACAVANPGWLCGSCREEGADFNLRGNQTFNLKSEALLDMERILKTPMKQVLSTLEAPLEDHLQIYQYLEALYIYHVPGFDRAALKGIRFLNLKSTEPLPSVNLPQNQQAASPL